ncbi:MAG: LptF/LptG family permease [Elusimicrobiota bacterium]
MKILNRYIAVEFFSKFFISLLTLTSILLMDQLFDFADLLLNKGAGLLNTIKLLLYILPSLFMFTVPMSILSGTILLFSRMNEDVEITAIRTTGISTGTILKPVLLAGILISSVMIYFNSSIVPTSNYKSKMLYYQILYKNSVLQFSEKKFIQLQNYDIYIRKITNDNILKGILIYKWEEGLSTIITAETAEMAIAQEKGVLFRLNNGKIFQENYKKPNDFNLCSFKNNEMILRLTKNTEFLTRANKSARQLSSKALLEQIKTIPDNIKNFYLTEYHLRFALGIAGFLFIFVAAPVSILAKKKAKSFGIAAAIGMIFVYYILLAIGTTAGERNFVNPLIAVWIPNFAIGIAGIISMKKIQLR